MWLFPYAAFVGYSTYFTVTPHGEISLATVLRPRTTYTLTVYVAFTGIAVNGGTVSGRATTRVRVSVKGQCTWAWDLLCESVEQMYPPSPTPLPTLPSLPQAVDRKKVEDTCGQSCTLVALPLPTVQTMIQHLTNMASSHDNALGKVGMTFAAFIYVEPCHVGNIIYLFLLRIVLHYYCII